MDQTQFKEALLRKRGEILAAGGGVKPLQSSMDTNSRQGDLADQASGNNEVHIQLKLKQTDAKILQAIEEALWRMEKGTYGICRDCGEPIAPARLERDPVDPGVHLLQGKTELVTSAEMRELLREFHRDKHVMRHTHASAARFVTDYDFNNTYQYILAREDMHLRWLVDAVTDLGGDVDESPVPDLQVPGKGREAQEAVIAADRDGRTAVSSTRGCLASRACRMPGTRRCSASFWARPLEHRRFFDLALAGRSDLLGRKGRGRGHGGKRCAGPLGGRRIGSARPAQSHAGRGPGSRGASMKAIVSIGSNLGDRHAAVRFAVERMASFIQDLTLSPVVETEPEGAGLEQQPPI
jgi:DnaK suppressor protein